MSNSEKRVDRYLFTFTRHYLNPIVSLSCLESHTDLHVRLEMFADLYHLTLRNHPSSLDNFISRRRPLSHHSRPSMIPSLCASFFLYPVIPGFIFSLLLPGNSFAGRGSQANLRGTHHRVISGMRWFLINGWEEDDPRAGSVYKHVGSNLDLCRSIIIGGLTILAHFGYRCSV